MSDSIDRDALKFIADEFRDEWQRKDIGDDELRQEYEEKFYQAMSDDDYSLLDKILDELENQHGIELPSIRAFSDMVTEEGLIEATEKEDVEAELSDGLSQAIKMQVKNREENEMIVRTDEKVRVPDLFSIQEQLYDDHEKKAFVISDQRTWHGRVSVELSGTKEKVRLLRVYDGDNGDAYQHIGESSTKYKGMKVKDEHVHGFFIYKFISDKKEYLLFSTEELDPMTCDVHGMHLKLSDYKQIGENTGLPINKDIIFAHSVEPAIKSLSEEEVQGMEPKIDHDWLASNLLGDWRHPEWFEKMLLSMMMVNEEHGYPSGLLWMASTGTGKSKALEAISKSMDEKEGVYTGSSSTVKGLTPSFSDTPPDEGYLLRTTRLASIDEVFNLLSTASNSGSSNMKDAFRPLLDLVEHNDRTFSSGNGTIRGKMEGVMIGAGNDSYGVSSMYEAADTLDQAFLGRFLLYEQTPQHIDWIEERKFEIDEQSAEYPDGNPEFISLIDHLRGDQPVRVDISMVRDIKKELEDQVPSNFSDIYRSRYDHHIRNLVSGHAKYRSLISGSLDFEAKEEDYKFARDTIEILINSWVVKSNMENMSVQARPYYLQRAKRKVYEFIRSKHPVSMDDLREEFEEPGFKLKKLQELDVVRKHEEMFYPYFAEPVAGEGNKKVDYLNNGKGE